MFNFNFSGFPGMDGFSSMGPKPPGNVSFASSYLYILIGVSRDATTEQIKKAFRKMAVKHHPDKGGDPEKFKEMTRAYEVLADDKQRKMYDEYGEEGLQRGGMGSTGSASDILSELFGMGGFGGHRGRSGPRQGQDVVSQLRVTLEEMYNGTTKKLRLTKNIICTNCNGKGGDESHIAQCKTCHGRGVRIQIKQLGPGMIQQSQAECDVCNGEGKTIEDKYRCKNCNGACTVPTKKNLEVYISKGSYHGQKIVFDGEADEAPGTVPGDVVVILQQPEHNLFQRQGNHLIFKRTISLKEALCGFEFKFKHLDSRIVSVRSQDIVKPGDIKMLGGEGMPIDRSGFTKGNLYIKFEILFPDTLDAKAQKTLCHILPSGIQTHIDVDGTAATEVVLSANPVDPSTIRDDKHYDHDDDYGGGQRTQCRTQ